LIHLRRRPARPTLFPYTTLFRSSDSRATVSETAPPPEGTPAQPADVPSTLNEAWRAPSGATPVPVSEAGMVVTASGGEVVGRDRSEEHTSELQSRENLVCRLLLE